MPRYRGPQPSFPGWNTLANTGPGGQPILTAADLGPLHAAVVKACDTLDGTKDGLIADPFARHWNPRSIACQPGQTSTAASFCLTAGLYDATDPDLRAFRDDGGKLILWQGLADPALSPVGTIAYYQAVENFTGGAANTQAFARLFMLPGVAHCGGGDGPGSFNGLGALVSWIEHGQAPNSLMTSKVVNGAVTATRPVCQYPLLAVDTTGGPVTEAASYTARQPPVRFDANIRWAGRFSPGYEQVCGWADGEWACRPGRAGPP